MIDFSITRVVTRNIVIDSFQGIRTTFGLRLRGYEKMINEATSILLKQMRSEYKKVSWWRVSINPIVKDAVMVTVFGEGTKNE